MRKIIGALLIVSSFIGVSSIHAAQPHKIITKQLRAKSLPFILRGGFENTRPKIGTPLVDKKIKLTYLPQSTLVFGGGASGSWQLMVATPDGKLYKDKKNGVIDMRAPPLRQLTFKIPGPVQSGPYRIILYVTQRNDVIPLFIPTLVTQVVVQIVGTKTRLSTGG
ncbi:MAG TPA: hypothetical protein VN457_06600, partial [Chlamydiales bacterium]|nr:hypothetical protein [Chlamydiales bacterium]